MRHILWRCAEVGVRAVLLGSTWTASRRQQCTRRAALGLCRRANSTSSIAVEASSALWIGAGFELIEQTPLPLGLFDVRRRVRQWCWSSWVAFRPRDCTQCTGDVFPVFGPIRQHHRWYAVHVQFGQDSGSLI